MLPKCENIHTKRTQVKVNVKVKLSLRLKNYHVMKTRVGVEAYLHAFLNSTLDGDDSNRQNYSTRN